MGEKRRGLRGKGDTEREEREVWRGMGSLGNSIKMGVWR